MNFCLPELKEVERIVKNSEAFYIKDTVVEGQNVKLVDYRLASISDFVNGSFELRGLCFVQQSNGTWKRHLLLNKFFNLGQTKFSDELSWMYEDVNDKKITSVSDKCDGSIISFVQFDAGIRAKSKMSFDSDQSKSAQKIYDSDKELQKFISICSDLKKTPIFELVGYENCIVLNYPMSSELRLLQIRDNRTGEYLTRADINNLIKSAELTSIKITKNYNLDELQTVASGYTEEEARNRLNDKKFQSLQEMIDFLSISLNSSENGMKILDLLILAKEYVENEEGEVISWSDGQMAKIKNLHYLELHSLIGPDSFRENILIQTIISGNIDDVISALVPGTKKDKIVQMDKIVTDYFNHLVVKFKALRDSYYNEYKENRKDFAINNKKNVLFGSVMKSLHAKISDTEKIAEEAVKEYILRETNSLSKAKQFVDRIENKDLIDNTPYEYQS